MGPVPTRLRIICQNNSSIQTDSGGAFGTYGFHEINIACKDLPTITMFVAATHELGHSAMDIYQIKHKLPDASDLICESWGTFTGYYMTFLEYTALGIYDDLFYQEPIPGTSETIGRPDGIFFRQMWKAPTSADSGNHYYTPIFVDMYDDYNQYEWFKIFSSSTPLNLVPNDNVVIRDARLIESIAFNTEESCPLFGKVMAAIYQVYPPNSRQDRARDFILPYISSPYLNYAVTQ